MLSRNFRQFLSVSFHLSTYPSLHLSDLYILPLISAGASTLVSVQNGGQSGESHRGQRNPAKCWKLNV